MTVLCMNIYKFLLVLCVAGHFPAFGCVAHALQTVVNIIWIRTVLRNDVTSPFSFNLLCPMDVDQLRFVQMHHKVSQPRRKEYVCINQDDARQVSCLARLSVPALRHLALRATWYLREFILI